MNYIGELWIIDDGKNTTVGAGEPLNEVEPRAEAVRAHVRHDLAGRYRPLSGARGLPGGWFVRCNEAFPAGDAVDAVYPLATIHRQQWREGTLRVVPIEEVLERQSGRYEVAARLSNGGRERIRNVLCEDACVRVPVWAGVECPENAIPCPEPCSVLVSLAREAAAWELAPPGGSDVDERVEFAAFDEPGNAIREAYLQLMREEGRHG